MSPQRREREGAATTPGALLAAARVRAGLSLDDVARRSKVGREHLEALEADDFDRLPAPVYVRGFLRLYAREVGLDPEAPIHLLDGVQQRAEQKAIEAHRSAESARWSRLRVRAAYTLAFGALIVAVLTALLALAPQPIEANDGRPDAAARTPGGARD